MQCRRVISFVMLLALLLMSLHQAYAQQVNDVMTTITIDPSGVVYVELRGEVKAGMNLFECPIEPIPVTVEALLDGRSIPIIYYNNSIIVVSDSDGLAVVSYMANVTIENGRISFYYSSLREATLIVPPNVLLTPESLTLIDAFIKDGKLFLKLKGPTLISFVVSEEVSKPDTITPPTSTHITIPIGVDVVLYVGVIVALIAVAGMVVASRKRRGKLLSAYLDEVDKAIIEKLRRHGGEVIQSVLYKELNLPKATVWRHVKRLEKMGYVAIERIGRDNKVKLLK